MKITFYGASGEVTGSNFLLETEDKKILIDCGLFQGKHFFDERNENPFPYNVGELDAIIITHAHIDHIGRLPKISQENFKGKIYSTAATRDFAELMLIDSLGVLEKEAKHKNKKVFYSEKNVHSLKKHWQEIDYNEKFNIGSAEIRLKNAGHILGSAMVEIIFENKKILFTGDLGNPPTPLLPPTETVSDANIMIVDSTYGGKTHEERKERKLKLERAIEDTAQKKGVLLMPAFSLERTQEILFEINDLVEKGRVPKIPVFVDSPLSIKLMPIYKKYESYYNKEAKYLIASGDDIFNFPNLHMSLKTEESKEINNIPPPKMIIAGSGMMNGGRINFHAKRYLGEKNNTILFIGFQAAGTLGRRIQEGIKQIKVLGEEIYVKADVKTIDGYSAHPDTEMIFDFIEKSKETLERVFCVHGEPKGSLFLTQRIRDYLGIDASSPEYGNSFKI